MAKKKGPASTSNAAPPVEAGFVFRGTVQRPGQSTVSDLKADARTAVVRVDEVIAAPPALAQIAGREVTVILAGGKTAMKSGDQGVFHATGVSFGEEIAVRAVLAKPGAPAAPGGGITAARAAAAPLAATVAASVDPVQAHRDLLLKRSLDKADVVVSGTITQVRVAPEIVATPVTAAGLRSSARRGTAATRAAAATTPQRISEHDPIWHEAVVNVESVEKGATVQKQVVVRFPASNDVRWRYHPKLRPGQQGVFLLTADAAAEPATARARSARGARALTTLAVPSVQSAAMQVASDPQPISAIERVRQLLNRPSATAIAARAPASGTRGARKSRPRKSTKRQARSRRTR